VTAPIVVKLLVTLALLVAIVTLSVAPGRSHPQGSVVAWLVSVTPSPLQKLLHVIAYGTMAALCTWTLQDFLSMPMRTAVAFVVAVTLGSLLEWYQKSIPGRFGTLADAFLNAFGAIIGLIIASVLL